MSDIDSRSPIAFVIMQIGDPHLDQMHDAAVVPAARACGLDPKRVDKHNEGELLKSEIVRFIREADIIVADLTNERPNCYLEVGYAMGLDKFRNLILTARADHAPDDDSDARVHFDLAGYDVLFWDPNDIDGFRQRLERKIKNRQNLLSTVGTGGPVIDDQWLDPHKMEAQSGLKLAGLAASMEVSYSPPSKLAKNQTELLNAAREAQIKTSGWPIGVVLGVPSLDPMPRSDCIVANIPSSDNLPDRYDYWVLRENGDFYTLLSLFEDTVSQQKIFTTTRIARVTEAFLHCAGLYKQLGLGPSDRISMRVRHSGLKGRVLESSPAFQGLLRPARCLSENEVSTQIEVSIQEIEEDIVRLVEQMCGPLFVVFDFTQIPHSTFEHHVNEFRSGKVP